jgi:hypothetical protein
MWAFFSRRLRMWLILAIGVPVLAWLLGRIGDVIESRKGPNSFSRSLQKARGWLRAHGAGPFARRGMEAERTR